MQSEKLSCRECGLCNIEKSICSLTQRPVTLDSLRKCKKGIKKSIFENEIRKG